MKSLPSAETGAENGNSNRKSAARRNGYGRREFLGRAMGVTALSIVGLRAVSGKSGEAGVAETRPEGALPRSASLRRDQAYKIRLNAAVFEKEQPLALHPDNGDETLFKSKIGSFSKGLPHNELGEVDPNAYQQLLAAAASGSPVEFEAIPMIGGLKLADPQAAYCFEMEGADSQSLVSAGRLAAQI